MNATVHDDMPYHRHSRLLSTRRRRTSSSSGLISLYGNAERSLGNQERVETGRGAARLREQGAKAQSDHQGNLGAEMRQSKEWINIVFAGTRWGVTKKSPKSFSAEHIFVNALLDPDVIGQAVYEELTREDPDDSRRRIPLYPDFLFLTRFNPDSGLTGAPMFDMVTEPDEVETFIGHVTGQQGPRSNLTRVEVVSGATIHFEAMILRDEVKHVHWPIIFLAGQENGLGAMRSQGYGRFDISRFEQVGGKFAALDWDAALKEIDKEQVLADYQKSRAKLVENGEISGEDTAGLVAVSAPKARRNGKAAVTA